MFTLYFDLLSKILSLGKSQINLAFRSLIRIFAPNLLVTRANMKKTGYIILTVTGVQYASSLSERGGWEKYMKELAHGHKVLLRKEPDNKFDPTAVEVMEEDYSHIGYIASEETLLAHALLDKDGRGEGCVSRTDRHKTFWIEVEDTEGRGQNSLEECYRWEVSQGAKMCEGVYIPLTKEERTLELTAHELRNFPQRGSVEEFMVHMKRYIEVCNSSIRRADTALKSFVLWKAIGMMEAHGREYEPTKGEDSQKGQGDKRDTRDTLCKLQELCWQLQEQISSYKRTNERPQIAESQKERILRMGMEADGWLGKYLRVQLHKDPSKATKGELEKLRAKEEDWLMEMEENTFAIYGSDEKAFVHKLSYLPLSRERLYEILGHLLTYHHLGETLQGLHKTLPEEFASEKARIFWDKLREKGWVDAYCQPEAGTTRKDLATIAKLFGMKLKLRNPFHLLEPFWDKQHLAQDLGKAHSDREKELLLLFEMTEEERNRFWGK